MHEFGIMKTTLQNYCSTQFKINYHKSQMRTIPFLPFIKIRIKSSPPTREIKKKFFYCIEMVHFHSLYQLYAHRKESDSISGNY